MKYTNRHILENYRILNTLVICWMVRRREKIKFLTKGTLKVYNLGRRKMIQNQNLSQEMINMKESYMQTIKQH